MRCGPISRVEKEPICLDIVDFVVGLLPNCPGLGLPAYRKANLGVSRGKPQNSLESSPFIKGWSLIFCLQNSFIFAPERDFIWKSRDLYPPPQTISKQQSTPSGKKTLIFFLLFRSFHEENFYEEDSYQNFPCYSLLFASKTLKKKKDLWSCLLFSIYIL